MNFAVISLALMAIGGLSFGTMSGGSVVTTNASALLSIVSIMAAAILVRLNRGIPTVDWKSVDRPALDKLLDRLEEIAKEYVITFVIILFGIMLVIWALLINSEPYLFKNLFLRLISGSFGVTLGLIVSRISYIIWLDLDIVRLQRVVITSAANSVEAVIEAKSAAEKIERMEQARITKL